MLSKSIKSLLSRVPVTGSRFIAAVAGCLVALATPLLALMLGHVVQALSSQPHQRFVSTLPAIGWSFGSESPLARVSWLLFLAATIILIASALIVLLYRMVQQSAVEFEAELINGIRHQVQKLAQLRTLTAQQSVLLDGLEYHLPRVRSVLSRYWLAMPRHLVQLSICLLVSCLIHLRFAVLACIAAALVALFFQLFERSRQKYLPVVRENATRLRSRLVRSTLRGPLLQAVHDTQEIDRRFDHLLELYQRDAVRSFSSSSWRTPLMVISLSGLTLLMMFVMSVQWFRGDLVLPAIAAFSVCLTGAVFSARRLWQVLRELKQIETAAGELTQYLSLMVPDSSNAPSTDLQTVTKSLELEHVTVQDTLGRKLLEDISLVLEPGKLIGIVASQGMESRTLGELFIGLGQPTSGRMLVDGRLVADFKADALTRCSHWVASDGGILTGSLVENLAAGRPQQIEPVLRKAELDALTSRLSEGVHTVITHDDDRLLADDAFRIGIARALLQDTPICVIEEPETAVDSEIEQETLAAIKRLVSSHRFAVILPQRLTTLRHCERVFFVHEHHLLDSGTHAELIQRNERYRHLTYLRFNPFRQ